jgi:hypothetical protein
MAHHSANQALNRLLILLSRSLPMYLGDAAPWVSYNGDATRDALENLVIDLKRYIEQLTRLLNDRRQTIDPGEFPMTFTDLHDLSLDFLLKRLVEHQRRNVQAIEQCVLQLRDDAQGLALAEEILSNARGHLETLESLTARNVPAK